MEKPVCYSGSTHYICLVKMTCTLQYCILIPPAPPVITSWLAVALYGQCVCQYSSQVINMLLLFTNNKKTHACVILTVWNLLLTVNMIMCSTFSTVYCTTHTQKSEHCTWLLAVLWNVCLCCVNLAVFMLSVAASHFWSRSSVDGTPTLRHCQ